MRFITLRLTICISLLSVFTPSFSQDNRAQIPAILRKAFFEINISAINYDFGQNSLAEGYKMQSVKVPHTAVRLVLFGYEFNKYLAAQINYMRPVKWVRYHYYTGTSIGEGNVWMNVGSLTLKPQLPIGKKFSVYGEGGLAIITRHGLDDATGKVVVSDEQYPTVLLGGGIRYHLSDNWRLQISSGYSPKKESANQPATSYVAAGFSYKWKPFSREKLAKVAKFGYIFPKQFLQIGYSTNVLGYGVNNFLANEKHPVFWGGEAEVRQGLTVSYQRNVFHGPKVFSLDIGASTSIWQTKGPGSGLNNPNKERFFTFSIFPVIRFTYLHTKILDAYFYYSVAGPTYISKQMIDGRDMGGKFTFQDNMGTGTFFGEHRNMNAEIKIGHYSNGNVYPSNDSAKVPLTFMLGWAF
ncbi:MAG TPA: acyloxyacyl hydrolase [Prolixibacteraceae bacterium]